MAQNIYDNPVFFAGYAQLNRSIQGLNGAPEWSSIANMLPDMCGMQVVDLGCGYGWFCRYAREQGASNILGLDVSEKMLAKAHEMTRDDKITYRRQDLEQLQLPENSHDLAYSSLALHYLVNLSDLFNVIYRSLKPGGKFIFSVEHPIFTAPNKQGWLTDSKGQKSWPVNRYQDEGDRITNWLADGVIKQHRTLATYINLLIETGFRLTRLEEWGPTAQQIAEQPALAEEKERPMLLLVSVIKP
ncbi:class I SAM-dependent methyltransferase [Yersinia ruckeri]|uniref:class I SAM-dependent methyltransferase n=1 Tax=Yersinia ruckeri TaxID=29486 RepID=UPI0004E30C13|nr:class I SAM-dependent methyltransferase [Yersinia ruckeri]ARZ00694.1 biotin synthesis protein BioC [Yersinia ruckeri]AUQ42872.1 class I SAM-dependent methyltransferase [Yersinia ruckeri]EKN4196610.1 class I SAM-dependent methyltransferase [Yersinia ruckeri]EKN4203264.1 class I SAM-dependent methyltransferase [Yersinia ruckeri]EKN4686579.1 class I SAM-dependent methyltransferase [Yersinia ruckeri]